MGSEYNLSRSDQARLLADNEDAIKALIEKDADTNFDPSLLFARANETATSNLEGKKFTIRTRFDTSTRQGPIKAGQYFNIHLDKKLTVKDPSSLEDIIHKGNVIARPSYDKDSNTIKYEIVRDIDEDINKLLNIDVDYNTSKIPAGEGFTVVNRISGLGVETPKTLPGDRIDKNGNPAGTIIEEGRDDVVQIIGEDDKDYKVNMDILGNPVVDGTDMTGINWTIRVNSTVDLKELGYKLNLTTVEGSGLGEIQNVKINGKSVNLTEQLEGKLGITDSKHHSLTESTTNLVYTFYTPRENKQGSYMIDVSTILTNKNKVGALRHILKEGYPQEKIEKESPNRTDMNNRTTIKGEFKSEDKAEWTITDAVSTGDTNKGLPLETRTPENQTFSTGKRAVYGINTTTGQMDVKNNEMEISKVPAKENNPQGSQAVGNIGVYKFDTNLKTPNDPTDYSVGGVTISKYKDIIVDQRWTMVDNYNEMPGQSLTVRDKNGNKLGETTVNKENGSQRLITIPNVRYWNIADDGKASMIDHKIDQNLPTDIKQIGFKQYTFKENANYYDENSKSHYLANTLLEHNEQKPATFTVIKVDSKNPAKRIPGATFYLLGAGIEVTTDANGEATFSNIKPDTYTLKETKAPAGYKLDQEDKTITISDKGEVSVSGKNAKFSRGSGKTDIVEHSLYPSYPDFMNSMHYGKVDKNGNVKFYIYLKPYGQRAGGSTDRDTSLNITLPDVDLQDVNINVYDVSGGQRSDIFDAMNSQSVDQEISGLGEVTLGAPNNSGAIVGKANTQNPLSGNAGYQLTFPNGRFGTDWGFLVEVSANIGSKDSTSISYDWFATKNPTGQANIRANANLSKNSKENGHPTITISNEELPKSEIEVAKFADTSTDGNKDRLAGAEFVLKDENGEIIANKITGEDGKISFGNHPTGTYYLEEEKAPEGYEKSNVYFRVTVSEDGKVTYDAKFKNSDSSPTQGRDYYIERTESESDTNPVQVTNIQQNMFINDAKGRGYFNGIWEAYRLESLKWTLKANLANVSPNKTLEIQFDPNLDFTQYFNNFPDMRSSNGEVIANAHFDYKTNLLTYVFNEKSKSHAQTSVNLSLEGMIPSKFYQLDTGTSTYTNIVAPGKEGENRQTITVPAYYESHDNHSANSYDPTKQDAPYPSQSYYFRDVYKADDGQWYVKAIAYYNPLGNYNYRQNKPTNNIYFNWIFTDWQENVPQPNWEGRYEAPFDLRDVKIYRTDFPGVKKLYPIAGNPDKYAYANKNMPLSYGVVPENDPNTYQLVYSSAINPKSQYTNTQGNITLTYNPNNIRANNSIINYNNPPLQLTMPAISARQEGYVIEQTFSIRDIDRFYSKWRAFSMVNGPRNDNSLKSTFIVGPNQNFARADQTGVDLPKTYKEVVGIINRKYEPGRFKITKLNEANQNERLQGATFVLTDADNNKIYRTSDQNGEISFNNLAPGKYTLKEYRSPAGFIKSTKEWDVTVYSDGNVKITSTSVIGGGEDYAGKDINIPVTNKPEGKDFLVYKKDKEGNRLAGAEFTLTKQVKEGDPTPKPIKATSDPNGVVRFTNLEDGTYVLEESKAPEGYKPLNKKWVLVVDKGTNKVYTYSESTGTELKSFLATPGTNWVNVKERPTSGWSSIDNRWTGWYNNNYDARYLGTRIIAINKDQNYVIQRYVINPEGRNVQASTALIHRQLLNYSNMDWYNNEEFKVFTLSPKEGGNTSGKVTGLISDLRLADYNVEDITRTTSKSVNSGYGDSRLQLELPATNKPIVIDVKIPYKSLDGGVGTGLDWYEGGSVFWKADYYERAYYINEGDPTTREGGSIVGSYISEGSLDVENETKTYGFKIKKVRQIDGKTPIPGTSFKLTGPQPKEDTIYMTSGSDGMIAFDNLKPGIYKLEEDQPAPGYQKKNTSWTIRVSNIGKVYIKDNSQNSDSENPSFEVSTPAKEATNNLVRRLQMAGANTDLEISGNLVDTLNPLRAGNGWEVVDNASPTQPKMRQDSRDSDYGQLIETKIIEIDKANNRYKQVFIYKPGGTAKRNRNIKFHRAYENYGISVNDVTKRVFQVPTNTSVDSINESSDIDAIANKTDITSKVKFTQENPNKIQTDSITTTYPGAILIEVETNYDPNKPIGLGSNYNFNKAGTYGNKCWLEKSYANEAGVPVVKTTVNHTITFDGNGGKWKMDPVTVEDGSQYELPGSSFIAPDGKEFDGWLVNGQKKNPGERITVTSDLIIQAQWRDKAPEQATVSFSPGEGSGTMAEQRVNVGSNYQLPSSGFTAPDGKEFKAWLVNGVEYKPGDTIPVNADTTITALWKVKAPTTYNIIVQNPQEGGTITAKPTSATAGTEVTLTVNPEQNYELETLTVGDENVTASVANNQYKFTMPAENVTVSATFKNSEPQGPQEGEKEIPSDGFATITNKQTGLDLKILKRGSDDRPLENAEFTLEKYEDDSYTTKDPNFEKVNATSDANGNVILKDKEGNPVSLPTGFYRLTETKSPSGYKKAQAPFDIEVYEESGQLKARYKGPENTSYDYIKKNESYDTASLQIARNGIKYKSKLVSINTESKTYVQRIYIDTRGYNGRSDKINIQISPKYKRDEIDFVPGPGGSKPPETKKEGIKTAYRSTYKITGDPTPDEESFANEVLKSYDLSKNNVTMLNTARWRPFDWGFDEDIMNLDKGGLYYIDVEGFYDDAILTGYDSKQKKNTIPEEDLKKLELNFDFYDGARSFSQLVNNNGTLAWTDGTDPSDSYLGGNIALGYVGTDANGSTVPTQSGLYQAPGQKYPNWLSKQGGRIYPPLKEIERTRVSTKIDIKSLYSSDKYTNIPQTGMTVVNEVERYNVTFSKHGRDNPDDDVNSENVTTNRLEGAIFKLQKEYGSNNFIDMPGSYVGSAFNGYFGFRNLSPGRYRLMEVKAPEGYKPIKDPLLYFTIKTVKPDSGEVVDPETGNIVDIKDVSVRFTSGGDIYKLSDLQMEDPKDPTKTLNIGDPAVLSKDISIDKTKIIKPGTNERIPLKNLIVVGKPQEVDGKVEIKEYEIKDIKIVPSSSGYISLEYKDARGVYQYVPEKSSSEKDGKLIDFVTSATAKNMGKIINEKPGKGEITVKKFDQDGNALKASNLLAGAKFRLTNLNTGEKIEETVDEEGKIYFGSLNIGNYRLAEIESPEGYINTNQVWNFTVGGKGLDPYSGPIARTGRDLSPHITLKTDKWAVINPDQKTVTENKTEIHPHFGESMEFTNKYEVDSKITVKPGDYFTLKMSDVTDLNGIFENKIGNLDILASGVGTIAKADYDREKRTITYTFTEYANTYDLVDFSNKLTTFIDLYKVKNDDKVKVGFGIGEDTSQHKDMKVTYNLDYGQEGDYYGNRINLVSKIVKYNPDTGEFLHYFYVNRLKGQSVGPVEFRYSSDQNISNLNISVTKLVNNYDVSKDMPASFGVDESSNNLSRFQLLRSIDLPNTSYTNFNFPSGFASTDSYIVKVTGRVTGDKSEYTAYGDLIKGAYPSLYAQRHDSIRYFKNEQNGSVKPEIKAVNPENKILFRKVDQEGKALQGAKFKLKYRKEETDDWSYVKDASNNDLEKTSGTDGNISFTKLKRGYYQLEETAAPDGYKIMKNPAYEFKVNEFGKIIRKGADDSNTETEEQGQIPIYIENKKKQQISFKKVDATNTATPLKGAEFEVWYKREKDGEYSNSSLKLYEKKIGTKVERLVLKEGETPPDDEYKLVNKFTSGADGLVDFTFYEPGYYQLRETKAPTGYIKPKDEIVKEFAVIDGKVKEKTRTETTIKKVANATDPKEVEFIFHINSDGKPITYDKDNEPTLRIDKDSSLNKLLNTPGSSIKSAVVIDEKGNDKNIKDVVSSYSDTHIDIMLHRVVDILLNNATDIENASKDPITTDKPITIKVRAVLAGEMFDQDGNLKDGIKLSQTLNLAKADYGKDLIEKRTITLSSDEEGTTIDSYEEIKDSKNPIPIKNTKAVYPFTGSAGVWIGFAILGVILMTLAGIYLAMKGKAKKTI